MVHPENTLLALRAVMRPGRLYALTQITAISELASDELDFMNVQTAHRANLDEFLSMRLRVRNVGLRGKLGERYS